MLIMVIVKDILYYTEHFNYFAGTIIVHLYLTWLRSLVSILHIETMFSPIIFYYPVFSSIL